MLLTSHGAAQMALWSRCRLRRTRRADVYSAALADVFPGATAYTARYGRTPGSPGDRARHQRPREGDRLARSAARRKAGGAVFSRQWRRIAVIVLLAFMRSLQMGTDSSRSATADTAVRPE